jgi:trk system potassium uptake protein TrkA
MKIIIAGLRNEVNYLIKTFLSRGNDVTVIHNSFEICEALSKKFPNITVVNGRPNSLAILKDSGILEADIVIAMSEEDSKNLIICQLAKEVYGVNRTFTIVNDPNNIEIFKKLGIDSVFSTTESISLLIDQKVSADDIKNIVTFEDGKVIVTEIVIPKTSPVLNKMLKNINFPLEATIGCIIREGGVIIPKGDTVILEGDKIVVLTLPNSQSKVLKLLTGGVA